MSRDRAVELLTWVGGLLKRSHDESWLLRRNGTEEGATVLFALRPGVAESFSLLEVRLTGQRAVAENISLCYTLSIVRKSDRKYLRVGKAAEELGLHPITIRRWVTLGKIQAVRVGIEARIPRSEIARLLGKTEERLLVLYARVSGLRPSA